MKLEQKIKKVNLFYNSEHTNNKEKINDSNLLDIMNTKKTNKINNPSKYIEKCEGCFENDGNCFCIICEKVYCKLCETQIHMVPSNMSHERYYK